ncbi:Ribosome-associated heat shock protein implicated in the recycling of the 50S subunit (S4 paralog) [plant metagenome]|uniref:Ribosome-associated heat shock protein implicated in the recycling of the 50S subunit (S4 paralog) n=1 Tax=plant metagenome TaxID=1297885 RepID=A0A484UC04_9ZZZZ
MVQEDERHGVRIDKWLWAARFYKTRSLASAAVEAGRVLVNGARAKPARIVRRDDRIDITGQAQQQWGVIVRGLAEKRGSATLARLLYDETTESIAARLLREEARRWQPEPEEDRHGRPTKRERRDLDRYRHGD